MDAQGNPPVTLQDLLAQVQQLQGELGDAQNALVNQNALVVQLQQHQQAHIAPGAVSRKIEPFSDPGSYKGERAKFQEWWIKMRAWVNAYSVAFSNNMERACAVWS